MTIAVAVAVVLGIGVAVAWALQRFMRELSRYSDWDQPLIRQKRRHWK